MRVNSCTDSIFQLHYTMSDSGGGYMQLYCNKFKNTERDLYVQMSPSKFSCSSVVSSRPWNDDDLWDVAHKILGQSVAWCGKPNVALEDVTTSWVE